MKLRTYQHFGMRKRWLDEFFEGPEAWWSQNSLGNRQFQAMRAWLMDCELIANNTITAIGESLRKRGTDDPLVWLVIWTNLVRGSTLIRWYIRTVSWGATYSKPDLIDMLPDKFSLSTRDNAIKALVSCLRDTPLGKELGLGRVDQVGKRTKAVIKEGANTLPSLAILYSLYRYAEAEGRFALTISELVRSSAEGPCALFGVRENELQRYLRGLGALYPAWIRCELVRDLDNVFLDSERSSQEVLDLA